MFRHAIAAAALALALGACATQPVSDQVYLTTAEGLLGTETALDVAVTSFTALAPYATPAQKATVASLLRPCPVGTLTIAVANAYCPVRGYRILAHEALATGNATNYFTLATNILRLGAQITAATPAPR